MEMSLGDGGGSNRTIHGYIVIVYKELGFPSGSHLRQLSPSENQPFIPCHGQDLFVKSFKEYLNFHCGAEHIDLTLSPSGTSRPQIPWQPSILVLRLFPEEKNWLKSHPEIFNPIVKQTGGTCFAVAALTLCEVRYALQYRERIQLSIDDILLYVTKRQVRYVLQYVRKHGVSLQIPTGQKLYIDSFTYCKRMNENDVLKELDMHPVCGVIRSSSCFQRLKPGEIYQGSESSNGPLHALLIVGYGSYNGVNFYLVRNSWGTTWCSNGYGME
ncbi:unnamed protein product [Camellia sinensis]